MSKLLSWIGLATCAACYAVQSQNASAVAVEAPINISALFALGVGMNALGLLLLGRRGRR